MMCEGWRIATSCQLGVCRPFYIQRRLLNNYLASAQMPTCLGTYLGVGRGSEIHLRGINSRGTETQGIDVFARPSDRSSYAIYS